MERNHLPLHKIHMYWDSKYKLKWIAMQDDFKATSHFYENNFRKYLHRRPCNNGNAVYVR